MDETDIRRLTLEAQINGVTLWVEDGQVRFKAPKDKLTNGLRTALQSRKSDLIGELSLPVFRKRSSPPTVAKFPACTKGFWEECEANASLRHGINFAVKLTGRIELQCIESAFKRLSSRHDLLRSRVRVEDDGVPTLTLDDDPAAPVNVIDLSGSAAATSPLQIKAAVERAIYAPFEDGRIYRAHVIKVSDFEYVVAVVIHHFVADVVSLEVVQRELIGGLHDEHGSQPQTGERPLQYADYLLGMNEWLMGPGLEYRLGLWKEKMRGAPGVRFPLTDQIPGVAPGELDALDFHIGETLRANLARATASAGVPFPVAILAANFAALAKTFERADFYIVLLHWGRSQPVLCDLVGFTVNCIPVRVSVTPRMSYVDLMLHVHDAYVFARDYHVPWAILMPVFAEIGASYIAPLFNYVSVARDVPGTPPLSSHSRGFAFEPVAIEGPKQTNSVDWKSYELHAIDNGVDMHVTLKYMSSAYQTAAVTGFADAFLRCLEALADDPAGRVVPT